MLLKMEALFICLLLLLVTTSCSRPDKMSPQIESKESGYVQVEQGKLYYQKFGSGMPIIVVHGGPGALDQSYLLPQLLTLAKDHEVIFYDQRGSGKSLETKINPSLITDQFVKDLEALRAHFGLAKSSY